MNERYESAYGKAMLMLARRENHKPALPNFFGPKQRETIAERKRDEARAIILPALPGTEGEIVLGTGICRTDVCAHLSRLQTAREIDVRYSRPEAPIWHACE